MTRAEQTTRVTGPYHHASGSFLTSFSLHTSFTYVHAVRIGGRMTTERAAWWREDAGRRFLGKESSPLEPIRELG